MPIIYFFLCLIILYFTKTWLTKEISRFVHSVGGNRNSTVIFWSILFLPGTVIHEISHFLVAAATGARTGKIEILPEFITEDDDEGVALGSVQTQKLNPIQGFLVGFAPFISGIILLSWLSNLIVTNFLSQEYLYLSLQIYLFFVIANSLFPSWADIRQTLPLLALTFSALAIFWLIGVSLQIYVSTNATDFINNLDQTILLSSGLNAIVALMIFALRRVIYWIYERN